VQLHKAEESAVGEEPKPQSPIDLWGVAERPQGPVPRVDALPRCPVVHTEGDEVAHDRGSAFPVVQQDRTQATPDVGVERAQRELLAGRGDPEELMWSSPALMDI